MTFLLIVIIAVALLLMLAIKMYQAIRKKEDHVKISEEKENK